MTTTPAKPTATTPKHTPGPWKLGDAEYVRPGAHWPIYGAGGFTPVAYVPIRKGERDMCIRNLAIIRAAPEFLASLAAAQHDVIES
jgi:hypothetical protein